MAGGGGAEAAGVDHGGGIGAGEAGSSASGGTVHDEAAGADSPLGVPHDCPWSDHPPRWAAGAGGAASHEDAGAGFASQEGDGAWAGTGGPTSQDADGAAGSGAEAAGAPHAGAAGARRGGPAGGGAAGWRAGRG